jgi:two-component system cell cycle sensor histidine kinase/response regulator CckA
VIEKSGAHQQENVLLTPFLSLVHEIAADAAAESDPDTCLRHLRAGLLRLGFNRAGIWINDPVDPTRARGTWGTDWDGGEIDEHELTMSYRELIGTNQIDPHQRIDLRRIARPQDNSLRPDLPTPVEEGPPNQAAILLRADGEVVGIISVDMLPTDRSIDRSQLAALELLADVVAVAIARGRVVDRLRNANEELRAAVAAAREAADRYRTVSELGSDYTFVLRFDSEGISRIDWITDSVERTTGYAPADIAAIRALGEIVHPDDVVLVRGAIARVRAGATTTIEHRILTKKGELRWVRLYGRPGRDEPGGRITRMYAAARDITTARRSDEARQRREHGFRLLFESNPHPMWVYELETFRFLAVNEAAIEHYGYSRAEFLAMGIPDLLTAEDAGRFAAIAGEVRAAVRRTGRWQHRRKDGSVIDVQISSKALEFEGQRAAVAVGFDLTELLRATEALQESEERFRFMAEATGDALYRLRLETMHYEYMSPAIERLTGYTPAEIDNSGWDQIVQRRMTPHGQNWEVDTARRRRLVGESLSFHSYCLIRTKAGDERWIEDRSEAWRDHEGNVIGSVGVLSDITKRQNLEEQLRQAQKMEAVGQLAGGVAHDFNNSLTVISGYASLLLDQIDPGSIEASEVRQIAQASESAASLTRQLLAFSRRQIVALREIDLNAVIEQAAAMLRRILGEEIALSTALAPRLGQVRADPAQIEQILLNLATNARDAMPYGGRLSIQTRNVELSAAYVKEHPDSRVGPHVAITIGDTGTGMDEPTRRQIFEPFFTTKAVGQGTGLGLAAVYGIVRQSGGSIDVVSTIGSGTTFSVYFPRAQSTTPADNLVPVLLGQTTGMETIILVEDASDVRTLARLALEGAGYHVLEAGGGAKAIELVEAHAGPVHLLLTDVVMPSMNGGIVARRLGELRPGLKVLYMSGYNDDIVVRNGVIEGGAAFLAKPFTPSVLTRKVRELLDRGSS